MRLREAGLEPELLEARPRRTNLVCRLRGTGARAPLMLTAHLDVVPAGEGWTHPPFGPWSTTASSGAAARRT